MHGRRSCGSRPINCPGLGEILRERVVVVLSAHHRLAKRRRVSVAWCSLPSQIVATGHQFPRAPPGVQYRPQMGGGQAIMLDTATGALVGGSDKRRDGIALG